MFRDFQIDFGPHRLVGDQSDRLPASLVMHGGGINTSRRGLANFRERLNMHDVSSCSFDFIGHGESSGALGNSTLRCRTEQAATILRERGILSPPVVIGFSMAGYTAIRLTEIVQCRALVLIVPAVYSASAYDLKFGLDFSAEIRRPNSWEATDAWRILSGFEGSVVVVAAGGDTVIPDAVPNRLYECAKLATSRRLLVVPGAPHKILNYFEENPQVCEDVVASIASAVVA